MPKTEPRRPLEELTPFARLLIRYMDSQWPHLSVPELADLVGISVQSVYDYFNKDAVPREKTLDMIAEATGLGRDELYKAAGIPAPSSRPWLDAQRRIEESSLPETARADLLRCLGEVRAKYESAAARG